MLMLMLKMLKMIVLMDGDAAGAGIRGWRRAVGRACAGSTADEGGSIAGDAELHDEEDKLGVLVGGDKGDNVRMLQLRVDLGLAQHAGVGAALGGEAVFVDNLDGKALLR
jgi:hypothetical protein